MKNGETNHGMQEPIPSELEARVISWVSGELSASESAELERLAAAKPEIAAFRSRVEAVRELAQAAVSPDREPLRLSEDRRAELMATFGAMRRRTLACAASFSVLLIAGIAWYGEITHPTPPIHAFTHTSQTLPFTMEPDPQVPVDVDQAPGASKPEIGPPQIQDTPVKATISDFTVPIEAPHPVIDITMTKIPTGGGGFSDHAFVLSQLDEQPIAKYKARPVYPDSMRQQGLSGEATVDFIVDPNGNVRNARAIHSSQREFEEAACAAVSKWTFRPGRKDGRAVYVHMQVPIVFTLSEE
jgi:protein TonB